MIERKEILEQCATLSKEERAQKSIKIVEAAQAYIKEGMNLGLYMAMPTEVDLSLLLTNWMKRTTCAVPKCKSHGGMDFYLIDENSKFVLNKYGIAEPISSTILEPTNFDVIFVPMVGFDEQMHRLGHGAGYYDRWLVHTPALKIGVAFEVQKCNHIIPYAHDIDMDMIITEVHVYTK